jgi:hypothetical protein
MAKAGGGFALKEDGGGFATPFDLRAFLRKALAARAKQQQIFSVWLFHSFDVTRADHSYAEVHWGSKIRLFIGRTVLFKIPIGTQLKIYIGIDDICILTRLLPSCVLKLKK